LSREANLGKNQVPRVAAYLLVAQLHTRRSQRSGELDG
jgi:hypothetical protein